MYPRKNLIALLSTLFLCLAVWNGSAQGRLVIGNTTAVYMVMSSNATVGGNPVYLVVGDATANAAANTITRNSGWIISEGENNMVKWYIGTGIATYTVPWGYSTTNYIPLVMNKTTAGSGTFIRFSTYRTATYQNSAYLPTGVSTFMSQPCNCDGSPKTVDRFWRIDARTDYTTLPNTDITFNYVDGGGSNPEVTTTGNTLNEADLQAQRYNSNSNSWQGALFGTSNTVTDQVVATGINGSSNLFEWWTLVDKFAPLPVTWLDQSAGCENQKHVIRWSTASEQNANYFTVERSADGVNFLPIGQVAASGNSSTTKEYSFIDEEASLTGHIYRIRETDFDGIEHFSRTIFSSPCGSMDMNIFPSPALTGSPLQVSVTGAKDQEVMIVVVDLLGQEYFSSVRLVGKDQEVMAVDPSHKLAAGVYTVIATTNDQILKRKIVIQ